MTELNEPVLADDYPVYPGYFYVVDGNPITSPIQGNVRYLKHVMNAKEVRRCDAVKRGFLNA